MNDNNNVCTKQQKWPSSESGREKDRGKKIYPKKNDFL